MDAELRRTREGTREGTTGTPEEEELLGAPSGPSSAVVVDVDGVLCFGAHALPGAAAALGRLRAARVPFVLLTNGGGRTERDKAAQLRAVLGLPWLGTAEDEEAVGAVPLFGRVVTCSTPLREIAPRFDSARVLITSDVAGSSVRVARECGFRNVVTVDELLAQRPHLWPSRPLPPPPPPPPPPAAEQQQQPPPAEDDAFAAVVLVHEPDDWGPPLQVLVDVLRGAGRGLRLEDHAFPPRAAPPPPVFVTNPDLDYQERFHAPRFTMGAFVLCLRTLYAETTDEELPEFTFLGKPHAPVYRAAERALCEQAHALGLASIETIYAVGDNPLSDIRGANAAGARWRSILVRSGCWKGAPGENHPDFPAHHVCDDLGAAVDLILAEIHNGGAGGAPAPARSRLLHCPPVAHPSPQPSMQ